MAPTHPYLHRSQPSDDDIVALTVWGEARGEIREGQQAVACVIRNRMNAGTWGTLRQVCLAYVQFECWWRGQQVSYVDGNEEPGYGEFRQRVLGYFRSAPDNTGGATHFFNQKLEPDNDWYRKLTFTCRIGDHWFYM